MLGCFAGIILSAWQATCTPFTFVYDNQGIDLHGNTLYIGNRQFFSVETRLSNQVSNAVAACAACGAKPLANYADWHDNSCGGLVEQLHTRSNLENSDNEWPQSLETGYFLPRDFVVVGNHGVDDANCGLFPPPSPHVNRPFVGNCAQNPGQTEWCQADYCSTETCNIVCAGEEVTTTTTTTQAPCS